MFGIKFFTPRFNSETFLFLILLGLAFILSAFKITFVYGITFTFTSIVIFLIFRLFGLPLAILVTALTFLFIPNGSIYVAYSLILLFEIIFVGTYFHFKKRAKMFFVDLFFWLTFGLATLFFLNKSSLTGDALYFQICKDILNGLYNVLIADMLLAYIPFYKLLKSIRLNKNNVSIHQFLSHITIISIMIPFFLIILTKTWNAHEFVSHNSMKQAEKRFSQIKTEILNLNKKNLQYPPSGDGTQSKLDELIDHYKSTEYSIIIINDQNKVMASSSNSTQVTENYNWKHIYEYTKVSNHFYEALPTGQDRVLPINKWRSGKLVFIKDVDHLPMKVMIQFPISQYQDQIFNEFMIHLKLSILFAFFTLVLLSVINRLFLNNLKQLTIVTTGLPNKLIKLETIDWPQSNISELRLLSQNLKEMAQKIKELFQESLEMNRILTRQTKKLKESEDKLHQLAYYDVLTSLPNRLHFQDYLRDLIKNKHPKFIAIIFIDLNEFKQVNDILGHDAGDTLLKLTAQKLSLLHNSRRQVFRLGGDEFVIVDEGEEREEISHTLDHIRMAFSSPFNINGKVLSITGSVGISLYPDDGTDLDSLVKCADIAMYASKVAGGNTAQFFNESLRGKFEKRLLIETSLRTVVGQDCFQLYYQPKIKNGKVTGLEALLRWFDPSLGEVSPSTFIPIAEDIGLMTKIDEWVLFEACKQNKMWQDGHLLRVPISVNISVKTFHHDHFISMITRTLNETGLDPNDLVIEITESVFVSDIKHVADVIDQIKKLGVHISIDDFGKGSSSFFHSLQLPIDEIKIDNQFINGIGRNEKKALLVKSIFDIAHGLGLNIVAEGIETKYERDLLVEMGCDELQGNLFSSPICSMEMEKLLK